MNGQRRIAAATLMVLVGMAPAHGGQIRSPIGVVGNTLLGSGGSTAHLIDQSGLSVGFTTGVTDFDTYIGLAPTSAVVSATTGWASSAGKIPGFLEFDLGNPYTISSFVLWSQNNTVSINSFTLFSASDLAFTSGVTNLGTFTAASNLNAQTFTVDGYGEFVRLQVNSAHAGTTVNVGEVAFDTIPEPGSLALFGIGLGGMRLVRRRT